MKFFLKLLSRNNNKYTEAELYKELQRGTTESAYLKREQQIHGLGKLFRNKPRIQLVTNAFDIKDEQKGVPGTAKIKDIQALQMLAGYLEKGDRGLGIKQSRDKAGLCYALICQNYEIQGKYEEAATIIANLKALYKKDDSVVWLAVEDKSTTIDVNIKVAKEAQDIKIKKKTVKEEKEGKKGQEEKEAKEKEIAERPQKDKDTVQLMLTAMASDTVTGKGSTLQKKKAQEKYFNAEIKNLTLDQLGYLLERMIKVQNNTMTKGEEKPFEVIRAERWSLFGGGNTDTWQAMVSAVKLQLMIKLSQEKMANLIIALKSGAVKKVDEKDKCLINKQDFKNVKSLLDQHTGRFYARWGSTNSSTILTQCFKTVESPKPTP